MKTERTVTVTENKTTGMQMVMIMLMTVKNMMTGESDNKESYNNDGENNGDEKVLVVIVMTIVSQ